MAMYDRRDSRSTLLYFFEQLRYTTEKLKKSLKCCQRSDDTTIDHRIKINFKLVSFAHSVELSSSNRWQQKMECALLKYNNIKGDRSRIFTAAKVTLVIASAYTELIKKRFYNSADIKNSSIKLLSWIPSSYNTFTSAHLLIEWYLWKDWDSTYYMRLTIGSTRRQRATRRRGTARQERRRWEHGTSWTKRTTWNTWPRRWRRWTRRWCSTKPVHTRSTRAHRRYWAHWATR